MPLCRSKEELLDSLKFGKRIRIDDDEKMLSSEFKHRFQTKWNNITYFAPYRCAYQWLNSYELCDAAAKFSSIIFMGDSLTRHHTQAMFMLMTDNFAHGGIPRDSPAIFFDKCACDGQFSEHTECRWVILNITIILEHLWSI